MCPRRIVNFSMENSKMKKKNLVGHKSWEDIDFLSKP